MKHFTIVRTPVPTYVGTPAAARRWAKYFASVADEGLGVDSETTGLDVVRDRVRFFSIASEEERICAPVRLLPVFQDLLEDPQHERYLTNAKFDQHMFYNHGVLLRGVILDTADMDFVIDENRMGSHGLKQCAKDYLGLRMTPFKEVFGSASSKDEEVRMLCEMHDVLELNDAEGETEAATRWAQNILLQLNLVDAPPELLKSIRRLRLALQADAIVLTARQVMSIAESHDLLLHSGPHRWVSEFMALLGAQEEEIPTKERKKYIPLTEDQELLREVTETVFQALLQLAGMPSDPVEVIRERVCDYASLDAWASRALVPRLRAELDQWVMWTEAAAENPKTAQSLLDFFEEQRVPFLQTLWNMERRGIRVDLELCAAYAVDLQKEIEEQEREIVRLTDLDFNPNSPQQLLKEFFTQKPDGTWEDPFGFPPTKWTKGGQSGIKMPSTDSDTLEDLAAKGLPLAKAISKFRVVRRLKGDVVDALPKWADRFCRIHTNLKSTGARTWRLSSTSPNLQNVPVRDEKWGKKIRKVFVPGFWGDVDHDICLDCVRHVPLPDYPDDQPMTLIVMDFKQLELCILAHFSGDERMVQAIKDKKDLHCMTVVYASELGAANLPPGITYEQAKAAKDASGKHGYTMTPEEEFLARKRSELKSTIFGIVYGIGEVKLGMQLGLPITKRRNKKTGALRDACPAAAALINSVLHDIYPQVGEWINFVKEACREDLVVYTVAGHPRRLPDIISGDRGRAAQAERQAPNSIIQGSGADICNAAMIACESDPVLRELGVRMLLQIHDELIFECPLIPKIVTKARARIKELAENPFDMRVPILVDIDDGESWADAKS